MKKRIKDALCTAVVAVVSVASIIGLAVMGVVGLVLIVLGAVLTSTWFWLAVIAGTAAYVAIHLT